MLRVIISIFLALILGGVTWSFEKVWGDFQLKTREVQFLKGKVTQLVEAKKKLIAEREKVEKWRALWKAVENSRFNPEDYVLVPVNIKRQMEWKDFEKLMLMVSNGNSLEAGFWFRPERLTVTRAQVQVVSNEEKELKKVDRLNVSLKGVFLLNK